MNRLEGPTMVNNQSPERLDVICSDSNRGAHKNTNTMKNRICIYDFTFLFTGYGHYKVTYISPVTGKKWSRTTNNMPLIDATKNSENPKICDLNKLKIMCKSD